MHLTWEYSSINRGHLSIAHHTETSHILQQWLTESRAVVAFGLRLTGLDDGGGSQTKPQFSAAILRPWGWGY
jgi:hypothetical protein